MKLKEVVLNYLREHGSINAEQAMRECGVFRFHAVIDELQREGYKIVPSEYRLEEKKC